MSEVFLDEERCKVFQKEKILKVWGCEINKVRFQNSIVMIGVFSVWEEMVREDVKIEDGIWVLKGFRIVFDLQLLGYYYKFLSGVLL